MVQSDFQIALVARRWALGVYGVGSLLEDRLERHGCQMFIVALEHSLGVSGGGGGGSGGQQRCCLLLVTCLPVGVSGSGLWLN